MTGLPGREDTADGSLVGIGVVSKVKVALGAGIGVAIALTAFWAQYMVTVLLAGTTTTLPEEIFWWAVLCGVVVACVLAAPVALRLWNSGVEGLRQPGVEQDRALRGHAPTDAAVVGPEEKDSERQLLEAIDRHGEITPVRAALETPLTVAEADRVLSDLAKGGHLQVRVEGSKLLYGL